MTLHNLPLVHLDTVSVRFATSGNEDLRIKEKYERQNLE
jgi:hypothetical protein